MYEIRSVENLEDFLIGSKLLYDNYLSAGLINKNSFGLYISPYHTLPVTAMYLCIKDKPLYTASLVRATRKYGLPSQEDFPEIKEHLDNNLCCEITCLAGKSDFRALSTLFDYLANLLFYFEYYLLVCHPRHVGYYERKYQAQRLSDVRQVHRVQGNPGILLKIDKGALSSDELLLPPPIWFSDELISQIKQVSGLISNVG